MANAGSPYARFRRSLETGNSHLVLAAARELPQVALHDGLHVCLVLRDGDPDRHERAAVSVLRRFALEGRGGTVAELRLAADALDVLPEQQSEAKARLQALCLVRGGRWQLLRTNDVGISSPRQGRVKFLRRALDALGLPASPLR